MNCKINSLFDEINEKYYNDEGVPNITALLFDTIEELELDTKFLQDNLNEIFDQYSEFCESEEQTPISIVELENRLINRNFDVEKQVQNHTTEDLEEKEYTEFTKNIYKDADLVRIKATQECKYELRRALLFNDSQIIQDQSDFDK